jgi:hypothetical protein
MSGRVAVRYRREPIILLYSLWSTALPSSSRSSEAVELIGVDTGLSFTILNFSLGPLYTWLDARRYLGSFASLGYLRKKLALPSWTSKTHSASFSKIWTKECEKSH